MRWLWLLAGVLLALDRRALLAMTGFGVFAWLWLAGWAGGGGLLGAGSPRFGRDDGLLGFVLCLLLIVGLIGLLDFIDWDGLGGSYWVKGV